MKSHPQHYIDCRHFLAPSFTNDAFMWMKFFYFCRTLQTLPLFLLMDAHIISPFRGHFLYTYPSIPTPS